MFRVTEIKDILNVSHTTIHKKLRQLKKELQGQVIKKKNVTYITEKGLNILQDHFDNPNNNNNSKQFQQPCSNHLQQEFINTLKEQINHLKSELSKNNETLSTVIENQKTERERSDTIIMTLTQELKDIKMIAYEKQEKEKEIDLTLWQKFRNFLATPIEDLIRV